MVGVFAVVVDVVSYFVVPVVGFVGLGTVLGAVHCPANCAAVDFRQNFHHQK